MSPSLPTRGPTHRCPSAGPSSPPTRVRRTSARSSHRAPGCRRACLGGGCPVRSSAHQLLHPGPPRCPGRPLSGAGCLSRTQLSTAVEAGGAGCVRLKVAVPAPSSGSEGAPRGGDQPNKRVFTLSFSISSRIQQGGCFISKFIYLFCHHGYQWGLVLETFANLLYCEASPCRWGLRD